MNYIFRIALLFVFGSFSVYAQPKMQKPIKKTIKFAKKKFVDAATGFELMYPDSVVAVVLKNNEDIKAQVEPFVIEVYQERETKIKKDGKPVYITMTAIPDDCYAFDKTYTSKYKVEMKEFACTEGAAGTTYYSFIYLAQKEHYTILLKFLHKHCNSCVDKQGKTIAFDKAKDTRWIEEIVESVQFAAPRK